jgi:hypothetical protein
MRNAANWCMFHVEQLRAFQTAAGMFHVEQCLILEMEVAQNPTLSQISSNF